jgi:acid stress-induced BolA-like protein IbaG/YrbA
MIDEFARVLGHALQLNTNCRKEEALRTVQEAYSAYFEKEVHLIEHLLPSQLIRKLLDDGLTPGQVEIFAEGVRTEADLLMDVDQRVAKDRYVKALALYEYVESVDVNNFSISRRNAIEEIRYCISAL